MVGSCDYHLKGIATKPELTAHSASAHKNVDEPIADPIAFLDEESRKALDLDLSGLPNKKAEHIIRNNVVP
jgi:hypothetical protein